ncbi:MAG: hypothetical protein ACPGU5_01035 [Lishizhenia sp.]
MNSWIKYTLAFFTLGVIIFGCRKEQPQLINPKEDCDCAKEISADFEIREQEALPQFDPLGTNTDTIFHTKNVIFKALEENAEYTWYLGNEVITEKEFGRYFSDVWAGQTIDVSLVVKKNPNSICLPNDDGYDSIHKSFYVQTMSAYDDAYFENNNTFLEGTYRVAALNSIDSFEVNIDYIVSSAGNNHVDISNIDGNGLDVVNFQRSDNFGFMQTNYRALICDTYSNQHHQFEGFIEYKIDGVFVMDFSVIPMSTNLQRTAHYYLGRKLS